MPFRPEDRCSAAQPGRWAERAACRSLASEHANRLFFPGPGDSIPLREAKSMCAGCPVRADCLAFALDTNQDHGVWGGLSERERERVRRRRRRAA